MSKDALALLDSAPPASLQDTEIGARREMVLGLALCFQQQFLEAERHLTAAHKLAGVGHLELLGEVALSRGTLAVLQDEYPAAEGLFRQSLHLARENNQAFLEANSLGSLGLVAMRREHFDESIEWYKQSLELSRSLGALTSTGKTLGNMGWSYYRLGDYDAALRLFTEAEQTSKQLGLVKDQYIWLTNLGTIHYSQREYSSAEQYYGKALAIARGLDNKAAIMECLNDLSFAELGQGEIDLAEKNNREAFELAQAGQNKIRLLVSAVVSARVAANEKDFGKSASLFRQVIEDSHTETTLRWEAEAGLAGVFNAQNQPELAMRLFQSCIQTIDKARTSLSEESRLSFVTTTIDFYDDYIAFLVSRGKSIEALHVAELSRARTLADGLRFAESSIPFSLADFNPRAVAHKSGSVILEYWLGERHSYLWAVAPSQVAMYTLPPAGEIDALVHSYRKALVGPRDVLETENEEGKQLFEILVAPAKDLIPKGSRVTILPDGSLYQLNFEALLVPAPKPRYWIEDVTITNANSMVLLAASNTQLRSRTKNLLLIGDPVSPNTEFPDLPQASTEMSRIEKYYPASEETVLTRAQATPAAYFESKPENFAYVHFVAHGIASRTSPLDSAVVLTKSGDSYKLYARDIIRQRLHADLVTISACHGAGERTYSGEGLVGLTWAFLRAGAHGVIAALWEVNDNSTPQMMDRLYSEISKGKSPDAALRDAKLALIHSGTIYHKPFYWAPFQIYRGS
ncbi:MAG: CHAT domain-containing protein [Candidatus Acidiferrales bacterium]